MALFFVHSCKQQKCPVSIVIKKENSSQGESRVSEVQGLGCGRPQKQERQQDCISVFHLLLSCGSASPLSVLAFYASALPWEKRSISSSRVYFSPFESLVSLRLDSPTPGLRLVTEEGDQPSWVRHPPQVQSSVGATLREYKLPAATGTEWGQGQGTGDRSQERGSEKGSRKPKDGFSQGM